MAKKKAKAKAKKPKTPCMTCEQGLEAATTWAMECLLKFGWYADIVGDDDDCPYGFNYHTHGVARKFPGEKDIQIVYPLPGELCHILANEYIDLLKNGKTFKHGDISKDILEGYDVLFIDAKEQGREVLRMILADKENRTGEKEMAEKFRKQWEMRGMP